MTKRLFRPGITTLLGRRSWIQNRRIGLVSHNAAVDTNGVASAALLEAAPQVTLAAIFGPEHGFFGAAPAGEKVSTRRHPSWGIPVHSLYGKNRRPTGSMLRKVDLIVVDLQDIAARPYTYVSTLRYVLEEAAAFDKPVIVADRPIPLPSVVDGPMPDDGCESFVAAVPSPMTYGMTPGETAMWLKRVLNLDIDLKVAEMQHYERQTGRGRGWPPWIPPSPGIASWESAQCYAATVFCEALPSIDHGRQAGLPFQLIGAPWINGFAVCEMLSDMHLPGSAFHPHPYRITSAGNKLVVGVRIVVTKPDAFRPATTGISIISCLCSLYGTGRTLRGRGTRPGFFDKLFATSSVREALLDGAAPSDIAAQWTGSTAAFRRTRNQILIYSQE